MKKVIFFRPGECMISQWSDDLAITEEGKEKTETSVRNIMDIANGEVVIVLSASNETCEESADIFDTLFNPSHTSFEALCPDPEEICTSILVKGLDIISDFECMADIIVIIAECPFLIDLHRHFVRVWQNIDSDFKDIEPSCGQVVCLDGSELSYLICPDGIHATE